MAEENSFIDAEEVLNKNEGASYKDIVLRHLSKISEISSKEMTKGYWLQTPAAGFTIKKYVPDGRKSYINAVDFLHDVLLPYFDEEMTSKSDEIEEEVSEIEEEDKVIINKVLRTKRKLFQQLTLLLKRLDFFEGKAWGT